MVSGNKNQVWIINKKEMVYNDKEWEKVKFLLKESGKDSHLLNE